MLRDLLHLPNATSYSTSSSSSSLSPLPPTTSSNFYDDELNWLFCVPTVFLACGSFVCIIIIRRANTLEQMKLMFGSPVVKRWNDYLILSLINALTLSDCCFVAFFASNSLPTTLDLSPFPSGLCQFVAMGKQLFLTYTFAWHMLLSCYIFFLLYSNDALINTKYSNYRRNYTETRKTFLMLQALLLVFAFICTMIPLGHYGSHYTYYDKYGQGYALECWITDHFDVLTLTVGILTILTQFAALGLAICKYKVYKRGGSAFSYNNGMRKKNIYILILVNLRIYKTPYTK